MRRDWLRRLNHDVCKHVVWLARDLAEGRSPPGARDLAALRRVWQAIPDAEGQPIGALARLTQFVEELDGDVRTAKLVACARAADRSLAADDPAAALAAVLALDGELLALTATLTLTED